MLCCVSLLVLLTEVQCALQEQEIVRLKEALEISESQLHEWEWFCVLVLERVVEGGIEESIWRHRV